MYPKNLTNESDLEKTLGINFVNKDNLHKALVHRSYLNENLKEKSSNERLEFLGDAILEFIVSNHLYIKFPQDEGHLTALRAKIVNTVSLASSASKLGLGKSLYLSRGEEVMGGRTNQSLLANAFEAVIGAIFIDQGLVSAEKFVKEQLLVKLPEIVKKSLKDPKSLLQEYAQAAGFSAPIYKTVQAIGPDHAKSFTVEVYVNKRSFATGTGQSKQLAAQNAAEKALSAWVKKS